MTETRPFVISDGTYRRRIELRPGRGVVDAAMEDFIHHFAIRLHHDGEVVTSVDLAAQRTPWSTCATGARGVASIIGTRLDAVADLKGWIGARNEQCVHVTDLAVVAASAALRGAARDYEIRMTDIAQPERTATMWIDGERWAQWVIAAGDVVDDARSGRFAGMPLLDAMAFSAWMDAHLPSDDREPTAVLRRATSIGLGRGVPIDTWHDASEGLNPPETCFTYRSEVVLTSRRAAPVRFTEDDALGTPLPPADAWEHLAD